MGAREISMGGCAAQATFRKKKKELVVTLFTVGGQVLDSGSPSKVPGPGQLVRAKDSLEDLSQIAGSLPPVPPPAGKKNKHAKGKGSGSGGGGAGPPGGAGPLGPPGGASGGETQAVQLKNEGNVLLAAGHLDEAVAAYSAAMELDAGNAIYYANRCARRFGLGGWDDHRQMGESTCA